MFEKFKKFAFKGNVVDMAVGVVVGGAFSKIVTSLVNDLITPLISLITGGASFSELFVILSKANMVEGTDISAIKTVADAKAAGLTTLNYGNFIQLVIDFFLIAFSIFMVVNLLQKAREKAEEKKKAEEEAKKKEEEAKKAAEPPKPTTEELLAEIRDLLKKE
ncbi:MAG: large conductance mechanosensitive channel protein MscL [Ruminococcaceae bacterium]|nr:large conductance mechanosensitive channel protein MscL [Oscillospiraceae bacterium]